MLQHRIFSIRRIFSLLFKAHTHRLKNCAICFIALSCQHTLFAQHDTLYIATEKEDSLNRIVATVMLGFGFQYGMTAKNPDVHKDFLSSYEGEDGFGLNNTYALFFLQRFNTGLSANVATGFSVTTFDFGKFNPAYADYGRFNVMYVGGGISYLKPAYNFKNFAYAFDCSFLLNLNLGQGGSFEYEDEANRIMADYEEQVLNIGNLTSASLFFGRYTLSLAHLYHVSRSDNFNVYTSDIYFNDLEVYHLTSVIPLSSVLLSFGITL